MLAYAASFLIPSILEGAWDFKGDLSFLLESPKYTVVRREGDIWKITGKN